MTDCFSGPQRILNQAIERWQPVALISLFSGGYDSMIATHILHRLNTHGLTIQTWAIDTQLAADGWRGYVADVADQLGFSFRIYDNKRGFAQFVDTVSELGCPRTKKMHTYVFQKLKERGFDAILKLSKKAWNDKVLFISGMRQAESPDRRNAKEVERIGRSNKIFAAPIVGWSNDQCNWYRVEYNLPDNPFYDTVGGSGDCQCNWGNFISIATLERFSPGLAGGNVRLIDNLSQRLHGFGWDGKTDRQFRMFEDIKDEAQLTSPFLCAGCSRAKVRTPAYRVEKRLLQMGMF